MAKKKVVKKKTTMRTAKTVTKKAASKKKTKAAKKSGKKAVKGVSRTKTSKAASRSKKSPTRSPKRPPTSVRKSVRSPKSKALRPNERLEKMTVGIELQKSGDLIATESGGGSIQVHHTVHPDAATTPIPGKSYTDLQKLGAGKHEVEVKRTMGPPASAAEAR